MEDQYVLTELALAKWLESRLGHTVIVPNPAAGAEISITVPADATWQLLALRAQLVTSAVAGNRLPALLFTDGQFEFARIAAVNNQATALTWVYTWANGFGFAPASGTIQDLPFLPDDVPLQVGYTIKTSTAAIDVGDQWSGITLLVRDWSPARIMGEVQWLQQRGEMDAIPYEDASAY